MFMADTETVKSRSLALSYHPTASLGPARLPSEVLLAAMEQSASTMVVTDLNGTILYANRRFTQLTGYAVEEVIGKNPRVLRSGNTPPDLYRELWTTVRRGESWRGEIQNRRKSGELYWESLSITPVRDTSGEVTALLAVAEDISARKRLEAELHESLASLNASNAELQQFNSIVSHDLQGPLGTVHAALDFLGSSMGGRLKPDESVVLRSARSSLERSLGLIRELLAFTRAGHKSRQSAEIVLDDLLASLVDALQPDIAATGADVRWGPMPVVTGNPALVRELFYNLITNAVKYRGDRTPAIDISGTNDEHGWTVTVSDNGIGIPEHELAAVFEPFRRGSNTARVAGTGLGLALCQRIVEAHGGKIWAESVPGSGTKICFTLRRSDAPQVSRTVS